MKIEITIFFHTNVQGPEVSDAAQFEYRNTDTVVMLICQYV